MQKKVSFPSGPNILSAVMHIPSDLPAGERRPAIIVIHGFGGNKEGPTHVGEARLYESLGYIALRVDMRGCGESGGKPGFIRCEDQVEDVRATVDWLLQQDCVRPDAIAVSGQSNGGAIAIYAGSVDNRVAAVISIGGWGNGARKLQWQNRAEGAWERLQSLLAEGKALRERTGETLMVKRWDIVPVPEAQRQFLPPGFTMDFPIDTPQSIVNFRPEDVCAQIAPRPFLIYHGANDDVTSNSEAIELFRRASGAPEMAIFKGGHFPFAAPDELLDTFMANWLARNLALHGPAKDAH